MIGTADIRHCMISAPPLLYVSALGLDKVGGRRSFHNIYFSGTASQVTPQARHQHANSSCCEVQFDLMTEGIRCHPVLCLRQLVGQDIQTPKERLPVKDCELQVDDPILENFEKIACAWRMGDIVASK